MSAGNDGDRPDLMSLLERLDRIGHPEQPGAALPSDRSEDTNPVKAPSPEDEAGGAPLAAHEVSEFRSSAAPSAQASDRGTPPSPVRTNKDLEERKAAIRALRQRFANGTLVEGKYKIEHLIAAGGMGCVFAGVHLSLGRPIALKVVLPLEGDGEFRQRFLLEASSSGRLSHRNIVTVHDYGETDFGDLFLVMERLNGVTLAQVLGREVRLDLRRTCTIIEQVCRALRAAHRAGVVHRDLKPGNIMLLHDEDSPNRELVKVLDFGLAKVQKSQSSLQDLTMAGIVVGSPQYMAPEQIRSEPVDARTDIYALGAVLFRMVAGRHPFESDSSDEIIMGHLKHPAPTAEDIPELGRSPLLAQLVAECLQKDPAHRPQTMDAVHDSLMMAFQELRPDRRVSSMSSVQRTGDFDPLSSETSSLPVSNATYYAGSGTFSGGVSGEFPQPNTGSRWKTAFLALSLLVAACAGFLANNYLGRSTSIPEPSESPRPKPWVQLNLSSTPSGANVSVDGRELGLTPLSLSLPRLDPSRPTARFTFSAEGFEPTTLVGRMDHANLQLHAHLARVPRKPTSRKAEPSSGEAEATEAPPPPRARRRKAPTSSGSAAAKDKVEVEIGTKAAPEEPTRRPRVPVMD